MLTRADAARALLDEVRHGRSDASWLAITEALRSTGDLPQSEHDHLKDWLYDDSHAFDADHERRRSSVRLVVSAVELTEQQTAAVDDMADVPNPLNAQTTMETVE